MRRQELRIQSHCQPGSRILPEIKISSDMGKEKVDDNFIFSDVSLENVCDR